MYLITNLFQKNSVQWETSWRMRTDGQIWWS